MKWIEIIYVRSAGAQQKTLMKELKKHIDAIADTPDITELKLYRHLILKNDLVIMFHGQSNRLDAYENPLGLHLEDLLKEYGLVNRSVWVEEY